MADSLRDWFPEPPSGAPSGSGIVDRFNCAVGRHAFSLVDESLVPSIRAHTPCEMCGALCECRLCGFFELAHGYITDTDG